MFKKEYEASWTDLDPNWHVANYAYNQYSTDARVYFFDSLGLNKIKFDKLEIGPILFYEQMYYYKEIKIGVKFSVTVEIDGYSEDGKFFKLFKELPKSKSFQILSKDNMRIPGKSPINI